MALSKLPELSGFFFFLLIERFFHNHLDASLFICDTQDPLIFVLIYVDDIIDTGLQAH